MEPDPTIRQTGEDALVARLLPLMPSNAVKSAASLI